MLNILYQAIRWAVGREIRQSRVLAPKRAEHLAQCPQTIRVQSGKAWISVAEQDVVLETGEMLTIQTDPHGGVISALGQQPVEYEINRLG